MWFMRKRSIAAILWSILVLSSSPSLPSNPEEPTRDERLREIALEEAEIRLNQAADLMARKEKDYKAMFPLYERGIITIHELNRARKELDDAKLSYEQAKLSLQKLEIESLKAAWQIEISGTRKFESPDGRKMIEIRLKNASKPVRLPRTSRILGKDVSIGARVENIRVSIKEGGAIIGLPYERRITLDPNQEEKLDFELTKDVSDVTISLQYLDTVDERRIHLQAAEPYIAIVSARKYKGSDDRRMIRISLRNGGEELEASGSPGNEVANIYVSIKDETGAIIGRPYEKRIPSLKYGEERSLEFELSKNVDSAVVSLTYLGTPHEKKVFLEPDIRYVSVVGAAKLRSDSGRIMARIRLKNTSKGEEGSPSSAESLEIRNILVSVKSQGTVIGQPYELRIPLLRFGQERTVDFSLQKDVDEITVSLSYLDRTEDRTVYLQRESFQDVVNISSIRFSQEGNLGGTVTYDLTLERLAETERTFQLRIFNLPKEISYDFFDPETRAKLSQIKFTQLQPRRNMVLTVYIPETLDRTYLDKPIKFYVAALDEEGQRRFGTRDTLAEGERIQGAERLELIPRGTAELELIATNLYFEVKAGKQVPMKAVLRNAGTRSLRDITVKAELPPEWKAVIDPVRVSSLSPKEEKDISVVFIPPADVDVGDYEVKLGAYCEMGEKKVEALEKNIRIHMAARTSITWNFVLITILVLMIIGVAILTVKVSRR